MPGFSTRAIRAASRIPDAPQPPLNVPIYATSTFEVSDATELAELFEFARPGHSCSRYSNPTHSALEEALAELEGGEAALGTASGMAAVVSLPASSSHRQLSDADLAAAGMTPGTLRVSIGLEDAEDLVADLVGTAAPD